MLSLLIRFAMFVFGLLLLLDAGLPGVTQQMHVDGHTLRETITRSGTMVTNRTTSFRVKLLDGRVDACDVGEAAYDVLHTGDAVTVKTSRVLRNCVSLARDDEVLYTSKYWKLFEILFGIILIAITVSGAGSGWRFGTSIDVETTSTFDIDQPDINRD